MSNTIAIASFPDIMDLIDRDCIRENSYRYIGIDWLYYLVRKARAIGIDIKSAERAVKEKEVGALLVCDNFAVDKYHKVFRRKGVLICGESPIVAKAFFSRASHWINIFPYVFLWEGVQERSTTNSEGLRIFRWPYEHNDRGTNAGNQENIELQVPLAKISAIASNKHYSILHPFSMRSLSQIYWGLRSNIESTIFQYGYKQRSNIQELYSFRANVIRTFARNNKLSLFGGGWPRDLPNYHGPIRDKNALAQRFKYSFCPENCLFQGYLTEKIFDAISLGAVPIWAGLPPNEVSEIIKKMVIRVDGDETPEEISEELAGISESELLRLRERGKRGLSELKKMGYCSERFADDVLADIVTLL